jgi:hypothetical protein
LTGNLSEKDLNSRNGHVPIRSAVVVSVMEDENAASLDSPKRVLSNLPRAPLENLEAAREGPSNLHKSPPPQRPPKQRGSHEPRRSKERRSYAADTRNRILRDIDLASIGWVRKVRREAMVVRMISNVVAISNDPPSYFRKSLHIPPNDEKRRANAKAAEDIEKR